MGNSMLLVCVDGFYKFVWLLPVREATTASTIKALKQGVFASFSVPEVIVSDNAKCFVSDEFRRFCFLLGIQHVTTTPYYPNRSHAERFNRNLRTALTAYHATSQTKWDTNLQWLQVAFNMVVHESTGITPFEVILPFRGNTPSSNRWEIQELLPHNCSPRDIRRRWDRVCRKLHHSRRRVEVKYNRDRKPCTFGVGDLAWLRARPVSRAGAQITAKLSPRWRGPFKIQNFLTPVTVELVHPESGHYILYWVFQVILSNNLLYSATVGY
jgi:hypothetical protein